MSLELTGVHGLLKRHKLFTHKKLKECVTFDEEFRGLIGEVRKHRENMKICPSARKDVNIPALIHEFCEKEFYRQDYIDITEYFVDDNVEYRQAVDEILALADSGMFD